MIKEYEISHHGSLVRHQNFLFKYDKIEFEKILKNHPNLEFENGGEDHEYGGAIDGPDNPFYFLNFLKELFPDKNFVMIQKDEYELMVESTNLDLKSEIMKIIMEGPQDSKIQVTDFGYTSEIPKVDNDFLIKLNKCEKIKDVDDDNWYSEIFEVVF